MITGPAINSCVVSILVEYISLEARIFITDKFEVQKYCIGLYLISYNAESD